MLKESRHKRAYTLYWYKSKIKKTSLLWSKTRVYNFWETGHALGGSTRDDLGKGWLYVYLDLGGD